MFLFHSFLFIIPAVAFRGFANSVIVEKSDFKIIHLNGETTCKLIEHKIYGNCLNNFAEKQTSELINKLLDLQSEINEKNEGNLKEYKSSQQFKDEIIPQILAVNVGAKNIYLKDPSNMSEIVAKFESFKEQAEPVE